MRKINDNIWFVLKDECNNLPFTASRGKIVKVLPDCKGIQSLNYYDVEYMDDWNYNSFW